MSRIVLPSPAKLNLFLNVLNKRPDGYHNIVTLFERIDLCDEISFRVLPHKAVRVVCGHPHVPSGHRNLVCRAARLLQEESGLKEGVEIKIEKRIPVAAGLAGGSSNAATALLGLNRIWKLHLSMPKLLSHAGKIGSDVAFFLYDTSWAVGTQRGDDIRKIDIKTKLWHILVVPRVKMYSRRVYTGLCAGMSAPAARAGYGGGAECTNVLTKINDNVNILTRNLRKDNVSGAGRLLENDLEPEIIRICPRLEKLKERLKLLNTKGVMISGSGPAVFGLTAAREEAESIKSVLLKRFSRVFVVRTL